MNLGDFCNSVPYFQSCMNCAKGIVAISHGRAEDPHYAVTDVLVQVSAVCNYDRVYTLEENVHQIVQLFGIKLPTENGKPDYVCEEDSDLPPLAI
ncbi:hypothetical protein USDA257_c23700 [Sinorhizobium fredii USDA 257]|uniref:Uncharacterized protein n=1 Tax=Sinorhizobium fredii (strain USDA 257) TaxID=1185652 RepID=I3X4Z1_SINF2|nr:hypothetical protein USDA257_c23700 [Sinorhizobium fredii USDA 257]